MRERPWLPPSRPFASGEKAPYDQLTGGFK
jgi:hypothetical protein